MKSDALYLRYILDAMTRIEQYTAVGQEVFLATPHWQDATIRQLEIIGEAAKQISAELRDNHRDIPWRQIAGLRDVLIHNYMGVDIAAVWQITQSELPGLKRTVQAILGNQNFP